MRRWAQRTHLAALLALAVAACGRGAHVPVRGGIAVTDDAGRRVTLAVPARRIVSLLPSFTEILFAIGAGERLVGRTTWCDYPPEALAVPSVGDGMPPSGEAGAPPRAGLLQIGRAHRRNPSPLLNPNAPFSFKKKKNHNNKPSH